MANKWIPTKDKLPQNGEIVLAYTCEYGALVMQYDHDWQEASSLDSYDGYGCSNEFVLAWMPLPKPYEPN